MDLGFSRRDRNRDARAYDADRLASLLAEIAMRQAMTATARMQSGPQSAIAPLCGGAIGHFVAAGEATRPTAAFHPQVAAAIVNDRQDS